jgi:hypothetical protein
MARTRVSGQLTNLLLRRAVREHAAAERRAHFVPILHVGVPGEPHEVFAVVPDEPSDHALRTDVVAAMRARAQRRAGAAPTTTPLVWLTRGGDLEVQDVDVAWFAAARQAYGEADVPLCFAAVNRHGWHDPQSGVRRRWVRARPES